VANSGMENNHRHLEAYFAITGIGVRSVIRSIPRLFPETDRVISPRHAEDHGASLRPGVSGRWRLLCPMPVGSLRVNVALCAEDELPADSPPGVVAYEQFIEAAESRRGPSMATFRRTQRPLHFVYTSGTTGNPKGVLEQSQGPWWLHAMDGSHVGPLRSSTNPRPACAIVPLYHAHGSWGFAVCIGDDRGVR